MSNIATHMTTETTTNQDEDKAKVLITPSGVIIRPNSLKIAIPSTDQSGNTILRLVYYDGKDVYIREPEQVAEVQEILSEYFKS